jgi:hypothetical protein
VGKGRPARGHDNHTADCLEHVGTYTSHNPVVLHSLLQGIALHFTLSLGSSTVHFDDSLCSRPFRIYGRAQVQSVVSVQFQSSMLCVLL